LAATDWDRRPIVDVVAFPGDLCGLEGDRQRIEVYRYREAPEPGVWGNTERSVVVDR
jgi:hypothetical protein